MTSSATSIVGWREWASLPDLGVDQIKVKIDTGAATSALHAEDIRITRKGKKKFVSFTIYPTQKSKEPQIRCKTELVEKREVRSSSGHSSHRPVIKTNLFLGNMFWPIEVTLVNRDVMGFRMLLGRSALRRRLLVDSGRSFVHAKPNKRKKKATKKKVKKKVRS